MKTTRQVACLAMALILVLSLITTTVNAINFEPYQPPTSKITDGAVTLWDKILRFFGDNRFTIVGQDRKCADYASFPETYIQPGSGYSISATTKCPGGSGLIDVFAKYVGDTTWYPRLEFKDSGSFSCSTAASGTGQAKESCIVEIYCCPHPECTSDSNCASWVGTGSKCITKDYVPQTGDGYPKYMDVNGNILTTYKTCSTACFGSPIKCYRYVNGECQYTTFTCDHSLYNLIYAGGCAAGAPTWPYTYQQCQSQMGQTCVPKTCSNVISGGAVCGSFSNGCTGTLNCGSCGSSQTCTNGKCINNDCIPDNSGAANVCIGQLYTNNCNEKIPGTKAGCTQAIETCNDEIQNQGETGKDCGGPCKACGTSCTSGQIDCAGTCRAPSDCCIYNGGTKNCEDTGICGDGVCNDNEYYKSDTTHIACPSDCGIDPPVKATVYDIALSDSNGKYISSTDLLQPGQTVTVKFKVRVKYSDFSLRMSESFPDYLSSSTMLLPVTYDSKLEYNVEAGIIPAVTAVDWFGKDANVGTFSFFAVSKDDSMCCENQPNIFADKTTYTQNWASKTWQWITDNPEQYAVSEHEIQIIVPKSDTKDFCPVPGREASIYWDQNYPEYILYIDVKNGCYSDNGRLTGYRNAIDSLYSIKLNVNGTATNAGKVCEIDADCGKDGSCVACSELSPPCGWYEKWTGVKKCTGTGTIYNNRTYSLQDLKKIPLTREEINKATTPMLFASSCYQNSECLNANANYSVSCVSIASLRADGTIATEGAVTSLMDYGRGVIIGGTAGALIGATTGLYICNGLMVAKEVTQTAITTVGTAGAATGPEITTKVVSIPAEMAACALWGAGVGGAVGGLVGSLMIKMDKDADPLAKAFNAKDSSSVGICTAEEKTQFDLGGMLKKIGQMVKITGNEQFDGILVILGGIFILFIFMSLMNKK